MLNGLERRMPGLQFYKERTQPGKDPRYALKPANGGTGPKRLHRKTEEHLVSEPSHEDGKALSSQVTYLRHHTFGYGDPRLYLKTGATSVQAEVQAHEQMKAALIAAFSNDLPDSILAQVAEPLDLSGNIQVTLDHINWGNTEMVYKATLREGTRSHELAVLINQPQQPASQVETEFCNLQELAEIDPQHIVRPIAYFQHDKLGVYVAPYVDKARCVYGGEKRLGWGMYDPNPSYHFEPFVSEVRGIVCSSMIALLVNYYDHRQGKGLAKTQLSGDDFIIDQDWNPHDGQTVLDHMKLISARDLMTIPFEDYLDLIRHEFIIGTHYTDQIVRDGNFKVNHKSGIPMSKDAIEEGISLGLQMRS